MHFGWLGALWVRGCFCKEMWRMYCSDTRVGEWKLAGPIRRSIRSNRLLKMKAVCFFDTRTADIVTKRDVG